MVLRGVGRVSSLWAGSVVVLRGVGGVSSLWAGSVVVLRGVGGLTEEAGAAFGRAGRKGDGLQHCGRNSQSEHRHRPAEGVCACGVLHKVCVCEVWFVRCVVCVYL